MNKKKKILIFGCLTPLIVVFIIIPAIILLAGLIFKSHLDGKLEKEYSKLRAKGYPVTLEELDEWYPSVPDDKNAALIYEKAFEQFKDFEEIVPDDIPSIMQCYSLEEKIDGPKSFRDRVIYNGYARTPPYGEKLKKDHLEASSKYLDANKNAILLLKKGSSMRECRFPVDFREGLIVKLSHLSSLRRGVSLLAIDTFLSAEEDDSSRCYENLRDSMNISCSIKDEPDLISFLVFTACHSITFKSLRTTLNLTELNEEELRHLQSAVEKINVTRCMKRVYGGELAKFIGTDWENLEFGEYSGFEKSGSINKLTFLNWLGIVSLNKLKAVEVVSSSLQVIEQPISLETEQAIQRIENEMFPRPGMQHYFLSSLMPYPPMILTNSFRLEVEKRVVATGLAVERYRQKYKKLPENLDQLVPEFIEKIPDDPYSTDKLKYYVGDFEIDVPTDPVQEESELYPDSYKKKVDRNYYSGGKKKRKTTVTTLIKRSGYAVYSVGEDGDDDKGREFKPWLRDGDISFVNIRK